VLFRSIPARSILLQPQVTGRLHRIGAGLVPGGIVKKGEILAEIEASDFLYAVEQQQGAVAQAAAQLAEEEGLQEVAATEWKYFRDELTVRQAKPALALRVPQLHAARATLAAAGAQLKLAQLNLERTRLTAPFDAVISAESAAPGQLVNSQTEIATLVATDVFWLEAAIPVQFLPYIAIPGITGAQGSLAAIRYDIGADMVERTGSVIRLLPNIDEVGRMAKVLVAIDDPLRLAEDSPAVARGIPLLLGAYVEMEIMGPHTEELIEVPRTAVHNGNQVFVFTDERILEVRQVEIAWERPNTVLISSGLETGDLVITSRLAAPAPGMKLRLQEP